MSFGLKLTLWHAVFFLLTFIGLYFLAYFLIGDAMEEEWQFRSRHVERLVPGEPGGTEATFIEEREGSATPNRELRAAVERQFQIKFPLVAVPMLIVGILGGMWITGHATQPVKELVATAREILRTGDVSRRVPVRGGKGEMDQLVGIVNRMLERNETLIAGMHESLDNVAHDLRTPMTRLRATAESALERPEDAGTLREAVADCMEESERVLTMLNTLMDVAEAETGAMRLDREAVELDDIAAEVVDLYELVAEEKGIAVVPEVPRGLVVRADRPRIRQALANLVDNAIKYSGDGTTVTIRAAAVRDRVEIVVADRGRGIPAGDIDRIWDRLYRGDRSRTERGLGLGLSFVRAIVSAHGGEARVESELNRGTTVTLSLPRA